MKRSSMVFWSGDANKGAVEPVSSLLGRKVTAVAGGDAALLALADDGIYTAPDGTLLSCLEFRTAAVGRSVVVGVTQSGGLYSWGTGDMGELGLGPTYTSVDEPKYINYASNFVSVSAGATHSTAVDDKGNAYAWGQNFDRQLGLYIKPLDEMQKLRPTASVEDLLFTPRFLPFSLANPVTKIACGDAFTIVATKDGALWSWGAGECGQLATGRCTKRELPQRVVFPSDATIVDVACGSAHVLALSKTSQLYTWGMNKRGQLGLDDTKTRHAPCEVNETCGAVFAKVYAHGHSSAALDVTGQLYTWGSTTNQRLMRWRRRRSLDGADTAFSGGGSSHCLRPGHAAAFRGMVVDSFAFSASASAALVYTNIQSLSPLLGPCKGPQQVTFKGYGLWDSDRIIVKFAHREGLGQSRSCPARFDAARGVVVCKPPKLVDPGFYNVALAMDGVTFQPEVHSFYAHREISATAVTPRLIDLRGSKESTVTTTIRGLSVYPDVIEGEAESAQLLWPRESDLSFFVKLVVLCSAPGANSPTASEVIMPAKLLPLPVLEMSTVLDGGAGGESAASFGLGGGSASLASLESVELQNEVSVAPTLQPITADRQVECVVDFSALGPPGSLIVIRTAVGINGIDFGPPTPELAPIICHSFQPLGASPCCCPLEYPDLDDADSSSRVITVVGSSFIPTSKLPPGTSIEAVVSAELPAARKGAKPTRVERTVAVECDVADALTLIMPTLSEMLDPSLPVSSSRPGTQGGALSRPGSQERLEGGDADARPPSQPGSVKSGAGSTPRELMCKIMFKMVAPAPPVPLSALPDAKKGNSPNKKSPNKAKKAPEPEPVNYLSPEAVSVFLYAPQGCSADPDLARRRGGGMLVLQGTDKGGFLFSSSDVRVVFSRPDLGLEISVPRSGTWMLGLDQEVPVAASAGPGDEGEGHEDEDEGLGLDDAAEGGVVAGGSVAASLHEGSVGSLGELSGSSPLLFYPSSFSPLVSLSHSLRLFFYLITTTTQSNPQPASSPTSACLTRWWCAARPSSSPAPRPSPRLSLSPSPRSRR